MEHEEFQANFERGMTRRRQILGDAWVEQSINNANAFNADFQHLITRFAWHEIWNRPGLEAKTRRIIVLSICAALSRWEEFDLHCGAALRSNDDSALSPAELKEVILQTAIYAGVPAANTAMTHAQKILRDMGLGPTEVSPIHPTQTWHPGVGKTGRSQGNANHAALYYSLRPAKQVTPDTQTIVLSHALGCDHSMWDDLVAILSEHHHVLAYDHRGHGLSDVPPGKDGAYSLEDLAADAVHLLDDLGIDRVVWIGCSLGGMVGQTLALNTPSRLAGLVIANSSSGYPEAGKAMWGQRIQTVQTQGIAAIADAVMGRYFHASFIEHNPATVAKFKHRLLTQSTWGYVGCCHAASTVNTTDRLHTVTTPTLVIAGELDQGAPVSMSEIMAKAIPNAQLVIIKGASHISMVEDLTGFCSALDPFLRLR